MSTHWHPDSNSFRTYHPNFSFGVFGGRILMAILFSRTHAICAAAVTLLLILSSCGRGNSAATALGVTSDQVSDKPAGPGTILKKSYFDDYILKAVTNLDEKYHGLGYDINSVYTHDLPYGPLGFLKGSKTHKTMCVASQLEVILTAFDIYSHEVGNTSIYNFLPLESWKGLSAKDIRGHIWVNSRFNSYGTADALANFGMGELVPFERLKPGAFINFNRMTGSGHAVTFISYIDKNGQELRTYDKLVIGFKYFSAQGKDDLDGGFGYRYGVFENFGCPDMPGKKDCGILYSHDRKVFDSGRMLAPGLWISVHPRQMMSDEAGLPDSVFDSQHYDGRTVEY
jgi:hypothetical protein